MRNTAAHHSRHEDFFHPVLVVNETSADSAEILDIRIKTLAITAQQAFAGRSGICDFSLEGHPFFVEFSRDNLDILMTVVRIGDNHPLRKSFVQREDFVSTNYFFAIDEDPFDFRKPAREALRKKASLLVHITSQMRKRGVPINISISQQYHSMEIA